MKRILMVAGRLDTRTLSDVRSRNADEVFVVYVVGRRAIPTWMRTRRFWQSRNEELDSALEELTRSGLLSDGIATADQPGIATERERESFKPDEVITLLTHHGRLDDVVTDSSRRSG